MNCRNATLLRQTLESEKCVNSGIVWVCSAMNCHKFIKALDQDGERYRETCELILILRLFILHLNY